MKPWHRDDETRPPVAATFGLRIAVYPAASKQVVSACPTRINNL